MIRKKSFSQENMPVQMSTKATGTLAYNTAPGRQINKRAPRRWAMYAAVNAAFLLVVLIASVISGSGGIESITYLMLLTLVCSSPLVFYDKPNGRYAILLIFMPLFFMDYGLYDLANLLSLVESPGFGQIRGGLLSEAELAVLVGGVMLILGYASSATLWNRKSVRVLVTDWKLSTITIFGLSVWIAGAMGTWFWELGFAATDLATQQSNAIALGLVVLRMIQPIGSALLIYSYIISKNKLLTALIIIMVAVDFMLGFVETSKELMIRSLVLLIVAGYLIEGKVPKKWLVTAVIVIAFSFSVLQAYRYEVLQMGHESKASAFSNLSKNLDRAFGSKMVAGGTAGASAELVVGRTNLKANMELIVRETGVTVPYQNGYTIGLILYAFIPRLIMPDKPDSSVGQLFTRAFHTSADLNSYTSATHMGELYWNFGWGGLVVGMFIIGAVLGAVGAGTNLGEFVTVTRLLLIITTVYLLCLRFEGGIALQYTLWIRSVILILLLHLLFRRRKLTRKPVIQLTPFGNQP